MNNNIRTNYQKLYQYNIKPQGTVQGPMILSPPIPSMNMQTPLYPKVNKGYNSLTFGTNDQQYYKINNGPYNQPCSENKNRSCASDISSRNFLESFTKLDATTKPPTYSPRDIQARARKLRNKRQKERGKNSSAYWMFYEYGGEDSDWPKLWWHTTQKDAAHFTVQACGQVSQPPCETKAYKK